jgi:nickel-dependent lactate racemase
MVPVPHPYDIVITTNSGYPLDQNLYQAVKGMSAASLVVRPGELLAGARTPEDLLSTIRQLGFLMQDQWQAQIQAQIQLKADVYVRTDGLSRSQVEAAHFKYSRSLEETLAGLLGRIGRDAEICVLPEGPQTIPYVQQHTP